MLKRIRCAVVARAVTRFAARTAWPVLLLMVLALLSGLVRTTALAAFVLVLVLKGAMAGLERLSEFAPAPRYRLGVSC